ncbi:MAG TPA: MBOAT family protein [Candidatus Cybelea sp.]|nr:MBOAT family protein [Candidatus Cybelea sp.]
MLFNSFVFILIFLPLTLAGCFLAGRIGARVAAAWLAAASLVFYGWWNPPYVLLLLASIAGNWLSGLALARSRTSSSARRRAILGVAVGANLLLLGYFKYANFFLGTAGLALGMPLGVGDVLLPLGISFFTFTQIAFLVDTYRGEVTDYDLVHYGLFVTFFPHLIAGPILHHKEIMPQFDRPDAFRPQWRNISVGLTIFVIGLAKKVVVADSLAPFVAPAFAPDAPVALFDAWGAALAYTLQIYFDFSGYSDMAIGLAQLFGIRLPLNFDSPYKARDIIDFWRRWHMTLSRFLRDYLYIPLGGNRKGASRRYVNLMATMLLGGLWHGAGWTFVIWGGLHGLYLVINHGFLAVARNLGLAARPQTMVAAISGRTLTFLAVVVAWVFFRAPDLATALNVLGAMAGQNGAHAFAHWSREYSWIAGGLLVVFVAPNTQQIMTAYAPALGRVEPLGDLWRRFVWSPNAGWLVAGIALALWSMSRLNQSSEFLYYNF